MQSTSPPVHQSTSPPSSAKRNPALTAAAVLLFVDAALALLGHALKHPLLGSFGLPLIGFEFLLGLFVLQGSKIARIFGLAWIFLFLVGFIPSYLRAFSQSGATVSLTNSLGLWQQILFRGSLVVLLLGGFGKMGTRVSTAIGGLAWLGYVGIALTGNPFGPGTAMQKVLREEALPGTQYVSPTKSFEISLPNSDWTFVKVPSRLIPSPLAEVGLVRRDLQGAMAYVIAEQLPSGAAVPNVRTVKEFALTMVQRNFSGMTVQSEQNVQVGARPGILVLVRAEKGPLRMNFLTLYVVASPYIYQVITCVEESRFAASQADLRAIVDSFKIRGK